jgi:hypothetical protein
MDNVQGKDKAVFENKLARVFLQQGAKELTPETIQAIRDQRLQLVGVEYFKRIIISGASSIKTLLLPSDTMTDGVSSFDGNKIPKSEDFILGSIFVAHGFSTATTAAASIFYSNLIPFYQSNANLVAGSGANAITTLRDASTSNSRVPEELLSAEFRIKINGVQILRKRVRSMFYDSRVAANGSMDIHQGFVLPVPKFVKQESLIEAELVFPGGVTIPQTTGSVEHYFEFALLGVGTKVKA